jgi:hypothetical protein
LLCHSSSSTYRNLQLVNGQRVWVRLVVQHRRPLLLARDAAPPGVLPAAARPGCAPLSLSYRGGVGAKVLLQRTSLHATGPQRATTVDEQRRRSVPTGGAGCSRGVSLRRRAPPPPL